LFFMRTVYDRKSCRLKTFEYFHHTPSELCGRIVL